jgi:hypothetical protein
MSSARVTEVARGNSPLEMSRKDDLRAILIDQRV